MLLCSAIHCTEQLYTEQYIVECSALRTVNYGTKESCPILNYFLRCIRKLACCFYTFIRFLKLGLNIQTLLHNICGSNNVRAFSIHFFRHFLLDECLRTYQKFVQQKILNKHGCLTPQHCQINNCYLTKLERLAQA